MAEAYPLPSGQAQIVVDVNAVGASVAVKNAAVTLTSLTGPAQSQAFSLGQATSIKLPPMSTNASNPPVLDVKVSAPGYGLFDAKSIPLFNRQQIFIHAVLPPAGQTTANIGIPTRVLSCCRASAAPSGSSRTTASGLAVQDFALISSQTNAPPYIRVGHNPNGTGSGDCSAYGSNYSTYDFSTVWVIDFIDYIKWILPAEWYPSWQPQALEAGAMAVQEYAWYQVNNGGRYGNADVDDSQCSQTFNPSVEASATNAAVDAIYTNGMYQSGAIFESQYCGGTPGSPAPCGSNEMSQNGSQYLAQQGYAYTSILQYYYANLSFFIMVPPSPEVQITSVAPGQNASFSYATDGATYYDVQQYNYSTNAWTAIYDGSNPTIVVAPANDGTTYVAVAVSAYDGAGWSSASYNGGYAVTNILAGAWPNPPSLHGRNLTDQGICFSISDTDSSVTDYKLYQEVNGNFNYIADIVPGQTAAPPACPRDTTTYFISIPASTNSQFDVRAYNSAGGWSGGTDIGSVTYQTGY